MHDEHKQRLLASIETETQLIRENIARKKQNIASNEEIIAGNKRLISLANLWRSLMGNKMAQFDRSENGVRVVAAPVGRFRTHPEWVLALLEQHNDTLDREEIIGCLAPLIPSDAKSRVKAVGDAISLLVRSGRIERSNGVYRLTGRG